MNMLSGLDPGLSGLEQLRALLASGRQPPICETLGIALVEVAEGFVAFEGTPTAAHHNPMGTVHGGYAATLLDSACGCAAHSMLPAGTGYTTLELKVMYHRAMTERTGRVRAEGRVLTVGRRAGFSEAKLVDAEGRLLASATSSLLVMTPARA